MENKSLKLLKSLEKYYTNTNHLYVIHDIMSKDETSSTGLSLRIIDWLVTNYSKTHNVSYLLNKQVFNLHQSYKNMLKAYSKKMFDPFRRHERVYIKCDFLNDGYMETTVAQLMFFKWCIEHNILEYAKTHKKNIKKNMEKHVKKVKKNTPGTYIKHNIDENFTFK